MAPCIIIYHANCCDGFTAAWVASLLLDGPCVLWPATYAADGKDVDLPDVTGRRVYMVDFCTGAEQLARLIEAADEIFVFDHHKSAERVCGQFDCCTFDMDRSGAGLTWDILSGGAARPWLVDYVEDRDLWRHALPETEAINAYIALVPKTTEDWDRLSNLSPGTAASCGQIVVKARDVYVEAMLPLARRVSFLGHDDIPVVNAPPPHTSDLLGRLAEGVTCETCGGWGKPSAQMEADHAAHVAKRGPQPEMAELMQPCGDCKGLGKRQPKFAVGWHQRGDGRYVYSLRSRGDFDVGALAQTMGGGGHPGAAGFTTSTAVDHPIFRFPADEETMRRRLDTIHRFQYVPGFVVSDPPPPGVKERSEYLRTYADRANRVKGLGDPESAGASAAEDDLLKIVTEDVVADFDETVTVVDSSAFDEHIAAGGDVRTSPGFEVSIIPLYATQLDASILKHWTLGSGWVIDEAGIEVLLAKALEAGPTPEGDLRKFDEGDLRPDRLLAFVGKFSLWSIEGETVAKIGHDMSHADPGVVIERAEKGS